MKKIVTQMSMPPYEEYINEIKDIGEKLLVDQYGSKA